MNFLNSFVPTASQVGIVPMITYYTMVISCYAFLGSFIFSIMSRSSVAPEHRVSVTFTAVIAAIAGASYFIMQDDYRSMLGQLSQLHDPAQRTALMQKSYQAIGQYRYMDWAATTPLLLLKCISMLKVKPAQIRSAIVWILIADFFMIVTGYIGQQQLAADGTILVGGKLLWGAISTVGYIFIPVILYNLWKKYAAETEPEQRGAFKFMALMTVTFWGVYPVGYLLTLIPSFDLNYIHISFSIADVINKVGVGVVAYLAAKSLVEKRLPNDAVQSAHTIN